jgi:hypothetical protein
MRVLIASAAAMTVAAAAAAAVVLHVPPAKPRQRAAAIAGEVPADAAPGLVWRSGSATLRLTNRPCPSEDLSRALETEGVTNARAYDVTQGSRRYGGCWVKDLTGDVVTAEPGRDIGSIPIGWFRTDAGG